MMRKAKKGFMSGSPKRKEKLRKMISYIFRLNDRKIPDQATEDRLKAAKRKRIIEERCGKPKDSSNTNEEDLKIILKQYHARIVELESDKYEIECDILMKQRECNTIGYEVNTRPGKYVKPPLKRVPKNTKQLVEFHKKTIEFNLRKTL